MRSLSRAKFAFFIALFFSMGAICAQAADPVVVELHYQNGVKFYNRGLYDRAIQEFEKTLSLEPGHREAAEFLQKVKAEKEGLTRVEAKKSEASELKSLYDEGKRRYNQRDYKAAIEIFDKVLEKKPVDDFASFYKERSEIIISRRLAREKKIEENKRAKERRKMERAQKKSALEAKKEERQDMLEKRREINERRSDLKEKKVAEALEAESTAKAGLDKPVREDAKAVKKQVAKDRAADKLATKNERIEAARRAKEEKREAAISRREEKRAAQAEKRSAKKDRKSKKVKIEQVEGTPDVIHNKDLFLKGVEQYGRREFEAAIVSFETVIEAESQGRKLYTNSAKRLLDKAKKKLQPDQTPL
ncbi:MAG TPA: hypothetical protein DCL35_05825 [Candidatus Omnitrophica bacterium]|nr:hypothetical protein [Candidatus Omnitrophota bacterium]